MESGKKMKRIAAYVSPMEKNRFLLLAREANVSESCLLGHWVTTLLQHKGQLPTRAEPSSSNGSSAEPPSQKTQTLSVRLSPEDLGKLRGEAEQRRLSVGGLLAGILRGRYRHDLYFSDAETQALIGSVIALSEVRTELARLQRNFGNRPPEAFESVRQQCQKLQVELETHAQAIRNLLAGNVKAWRQPS